MINNFFCLTGKAQHLPGVTSYNGDLKLTRYQSLEAAPSLASVHFIPVSSVQ